MPPSDVLLAHLSDPHLFVPAAARASWMLDKRALGLANAWLRRRKVHRQEVLEATLDALLAHQPDHLVVTGDVSTVGAEAEMVAFRRVLERKGLGPDRVTVLPGNHDAYVWAAVRSRAFERVFGAYCTDDLDPAPAAPGGTAPGDAPWPRVRIRGHLALVALCSARPSGPLLALGSLGTSQVSRLERLLDRRELRERTVVLALHHPVQPAAAHWHNRLTDAPALRAVLAARSAALLVHGHLHRFLRAQIAGPGCEVPVVGAPSASARLRRPSCRGGGVLYRLRGQRLVGVERVEGWRPPGR